MNSETHKITTMTTFCMIVLRELRTERGFHQAQVADWIGKTPSAWTKIESGKSPLQFETFIRVCNSFQVQPSAVMATAERYAVLFSQNTWAVLSSELEANEDALLRLAQEYWASPGGRNASLNRWSFPSILSGPTYNNLDNKITLAAVFQYALDPEFRAAQLTSPLEPPTANRV